MADFYYQTSISVRGLWLLDSAQLTELDAIVTEQWKRLNEYREKKIEKELEQALPGEIETAYPKPEKKKDKDIIREALRERISKRFQNENKHLEVALFLSGGKKLVANSIKEVIQHAGASEAKIEKLTLNLNVADVDTDFEIDAHYNQVSCRVSPEELPESRETFAVLRDWIAKHQPKRWQWAWSELAALLWAVWFAYCFLSATILETKSKSRTSPSQFQTQAVDMVKQGITITNQPKAIELMLALQTGYNPNQSPAKSPKWWLPSVICSLLACVIFSIKPSSCIGIGMTERRVHFWRGWIRLLTVIIPGLLFSSFAWPALSDFIKSLFK